MKHLSYFKIFENLQENEKEFLDDLPHINDILNIARDKGHVVYVEEVEYFDYYRIEIVNYDMGDDFIIVSKEILNRLLALEYEITTEIMRRNYTRSTWNTVRLEDNNIDNFTDDEVLMVIFKIHL